MAVTIKSGREIELMREAGRILSKVHEELEKELRAGMTTKDIDRLGEQIIRDHGCEPSFLGYAGFPASICVSLNEVVVHGIPSDDVVIKDGDVVSLDAGVIWHGYQSDAARTWIVGEGTPEARKLVEDTRQSFFEGIKKAVAGNHINDIGIAVQTYCESRGYGVVRDLVGHGIGTEMHEDPEVPNFDMGRRGLRLRAGMTIAVEPMITAGTWEVEQLDDGWTIVTKDRSLAAHYENTILITDGEPEILSLV